MRYLNKLLNNSNSIIYKTLKECTIMQRGKSLTKKKAIEGIYPVVAGGKEPAFYCNQYNREGETITIAGSGSAGFVQYWHTPIFVSDAFSIQTKEDLLTKYLYYYLLSIQEKIDAVKTNGVIPHLYISSIEHFEVPIPPIEVQQKIINFLDRLSTVTTKLIEKIHLEQALRKKQYLYYLEHLLTSYPHPQKYLLKEIATVTKLAGFEFTKYVTYSDCGKIIALRGLNIKNGKLNLENIKYIDESDLSKLARSKLYLDDMLFTYVGTIGQVALINEDNRYYLAPNVALIRFNKELVLPKYMCYYFQTPFFKHNQIDRLLQASTIKNIPMNKIRQFECAIPSLEEQKRIVKHLDQLDALYRNFTINLSDEIIARQKQATYYRNQLLSFDI